MTSVIPQPVVAQLTRAAIFLVVTVNPEPEHRAAVRALCGDLAALLRAVGFRDLEGHLSCVMAFGSDAWDRLFGPPRPKELHPFREVRGRHHALSTPGDILFHVRAARMDLCFELATQIMSRLSGAVSRVDEVHGFNYFDNRDLIGFVDGTENPAEQAAIEATIIGEEPAPSRIKRAMALTLTDWLISARCWFMASMLTVGMTRAAPVPRGLADGAEQGGPGEPPVALDPRTRAALGPDAGQRALACNPGFILKPDFDRPAGKLRRDCGARQLGEVF